ncbi:MAG: C40 family peptidase [Lachnospiraceae bacterium]|nr:C40 family peptidase [Lachnospiraceae bacterium]
MMNKWKKTLALAISGILIVGTIVAPIQAAMVGTVEQIEGANVLLDQYCGDVASGYVLAQTPELLMAEQPTATPAPSATPSAEPAKEETSGHVELNLNYSRLGIANKVDTYLNIRKKPSTSAAIVGKLTKNAGCHIYKIKKGWAKIVSGGVNGWVKASYMTTDKKAEELASKVGRDCVEIQTDSLRVRALPTTDAPIYSVVSAGEEFRIKKRNLTVDFVKEIVKKEKISKEALTRSGGYEAIEKSMGDFICIYVDNEYAFVAKEYVKEQYSLKRAVKVGTVSASASSGISSSQASIVEYAKQFLGNPYVWGGSSLTGGTDCSGFTMSLYRRYGYSLPHNAAAQSGVTRSVSDPKPGDLFFYSNGSRINHVAMYIGGGMVIHASNPSDGIKISNAYYRHPVKIGRVM